MDDLVRWLGKQLDADERLARAATRGPWVQSGIGDYGWTVDFGRPGSGVETADTEQGLADADFIAAHNPSRVLREIDAKRQLLAAYSQVAANDLNEVEYAHGWANALGLAVRQLATAYADRPGYRKDWRP